MVDARFEEGMLFLVNGGRAFEVLGVEPGGPVTGRQLMFFVLADSV